jgi:hypothetical protein
MTSLKLRTTSFAGLFGSVVSLAVVGCAPSVPAPQNLLSVGRIEHSSGVIREQRLVDGIIPSRESPIDDFTASLFLEPGAEVVFRLDGLVARAVRLLAADDAILVEVKTREEDFVEVPLVFSDSLGPLGVWSHDGLDRPIFALRISLRADRRMGAVGEVLVLADVPNSLGLRFQQPPGFQETVDRLLARQVRVRRLTVLAAALSLLLIVLVVYGNRSRKLAACVSLITIGGASWLGFGTLHGDGRLLHPWELTHYYLGAQYFPEMRYREFYRCLAAVEIQNGRRSMVERVDIRDLDTYGLHPGTWASSPAGACRADFSAERWTDFSRDADSLRRLFQYRRFHATLGDHGYNATPLNTSVLRRITDYVNPTSGSLQVLAVVDLLFVASAVALIAWAFGPVAGGVAALIVGFGYPWEFVWTAGSLGRFGWLVALVAGIACLKRQRFLAGGALIALSGMLRLFPMVLLAGLAWRFVRRSMGRRTGAEDRAIAAGVAGVLVIGLIVPTLEFGVEVYGDFLQNSELHASRPPGNDIGLAALIESTLPAQISAAPGNGAGQTGMVHMTLWLLGLLGAALALVSIERREVTSWALVVWSAPLLYASLPLSGYDYMWLIILAPVLTTTSVTATMGVLLVALTKVIPEFVEDIPTQFTVANALLFSGIVALTVWQLSNSRGETRS